MTSWIALAEARFAENASSSAAKTDNFPISSVSAASIKRTSEQSQQGFVSFGSMPDVDWEKNSIPYDLAVESGAIGPESESQHQGDTWEREQHSNSFVAHVKDKGTLATSTCLPADLLVQFQLDRFSEETRAHREAGHDPDEVLRVNNLAYHLVSVKAWSFATAMGAAAEWVVNNPKHPDETAFADVMQIYGKRVQSGNQPDSAAGYDDHLGSGEKHDQKG